MIASIVAVLALNSRDPYQGFQARLYPFGAESPAPYSVERLKEQAFDVTSLFYADREEIILLLGLAKEKVPFDPRAVNLYVRFKGNEWAVDRFGTVRVGKSDARLSREDFWMLRRRISAMLPEQPPEPAYGTSLPRRRVARTVNRGA